MAVGKHREASIGSEENKMKSLKFMDFIVPGLFVMILIMLTIFVYVPSLSDASDMRAQIDEIREKQDTLQRNLDTIAPFLENPAQLSSDFKTTERIIPQKLDVADFSYFVDKLARDAGLDFKEITQQGSSNSTPSETVSSNNNLASYVKGVSGPIVYEGTYSEIVEFLDQLQKESPYIIEARQLELKSTRAAVDPSEVARGDIWRIELNLMGYFIEQESDVSLASIYQRIIPYTQYPNLMEIFDYKNDIVNRVNE